MKLIILIAFVLIIGSLASAMVFLVRDKGNGKNVAWALTARVGFSIGLFALLLFAHYMGWVESTGLPLGR